MKPKAPVRGKSAKNKTPSEMFSKPVKAAPKSKRKMSTAQKFEKYL
jgi:hypothetical protein